MSDGKKHRYSCHKAVGTALVTIIYIMTGSLLVLHKLLLKCAHNKYSFLEEISFETVFFIPSVSTFGAIIYRIRI